MLFRIIKNINLEIILIYAQNNYPFFDFCITDRFHSTIFSIKGIIPFLVLEYTSKYKGAHQGKIVDLLTKINKMKMFPFL